MSNRADRPFESFTDLDLKGIVCEACVFGTKFGSQHIPGCPNAPKPEK